MSRYEVEHVLMTADAVGGVWTYCLDLARELTKWDIRVTLATMGPRPTARQVADARSIPGLALAESDFRLEWADDCWEDVQAAGAWLLGLAQQLKPDIVHLNGFCHAGLPWQRPTIVVAHSDVVSWCRAVRRNDPPAEWDEYRFRVEAGLRAADLVVAPTAAVLKEIEDAYGHLPRTRVIYNGRQAPRTVELAKQPFVLSSGRLWDEAKNVASLEAIADRISWPIYVAGETSDATRGVHSLGRLSPSDMFTWMERASIYAHPAKYEPFGLSILEAAQRGCALVLGNIPSLRELWQGAAVFVDPFDHRVIDDAINYLIDHDDVRTTMARAAISRSQLYSSRAFGCAYLFAYQDLVQTASLPTVVSLPEVSVL